MHRSIRSLFAVAAMFATGSAFCLEPEVIWERVSPSVVRVETTMLDGEQMQGSGFVCEIEGKKYVLSNRHVVIGAKQVRVGPSADKLTVAPGYRISPELDLALIDLPQQLPSPALQKRTTGLKTGERVYAIGFPLGLNKSITQGLLSSQTEKVIQFDAPISSGSSGGPLVDKDGLVVGVVTAGSTGSSQEVAQNLNFAIKTAFVPKLSLFRDPIISFYDAWRELVNVENALIDGLKAQRVVETYTYLQRELAAAISSQGKASLTAEQIRQLEELQSESLKDIAGRHGNITQAAKAVAVYLRKQISEFDRIPELFIALGKQELLKEFARDNRPGGLFRLQVEESDIPPLLRISLEHVKAKYEDTAYQIEFLANVLPKLKQRDAEFIKAFLQIDEQVRQNQRAAVRLDYKTLGKASTDTERLLLFRKSMIPHRPENSDPTIFERKLSAKEQFTFWGGFERELTTMFQRLAIAKLQSGNIEKAIGYVRNDVSIRKFGDYRLLAHLTAGSGKFDAAYGLYEKAFMDSADMFNPFSLEMDGNTSRSLIVGELKDDGTAFWSYPAPVRKNLSDWHNYVLRKGVLGLSNLPTLDEALTSKSFREATEFEQYFVLHSFQSRALRDADGGFKKFLKAVESDSTATRVYDKFF